MIEPKDALFTRNNSQNFLGNGTQDTHYAESTNRAANVDRIGCVITDYQSLKSNIPLNLNVHKDINGKIKKQVIQRTNNTYKGYNSRYYFDDIQQRKYYETLVYENVGIVKILPEDIICWYPGFNLPIGTRGRSLLRKDLHRQRSISTSNCDNMLVSNKLNITNRSTFGDMRIADLYHSAHVLGIWNSAAHYCLETCERRGFRKEWILCLKESGYEINMNNLKEIKQYMLEKYRR